MNLDTAAQFLAHALTLIATDIAAVDAAHPYGDGQMATVLDAQFPPEILRRERVYLTHEGHHDLIVSVGRIERVAEMQTSLALARRGDAYPEMGEAYWLRTFEAERRRFVASFGAAQVVFSA